MSPPTECLDDRPESAPRELPGAMLRHAREARGLSLDDLTRTTKIGRSTLVAIESSDVLRLPAAIYTRGFVKAYAEEVGLPAEATAEEYLRRIEPMTTEHLLVDDGLLPPLATDNPDNVDANGDSRHLLAENQVRRFGRLTTLAAAIGLIFYLVSFNRQADRKEQTAAAAPAADATHAAAPPEAAVPRLAVDAVQTTASGPLEIELTLQGPCWLVATVDGERVVARLLQPGERQTLAITDEALLRVGDPGAVSISINGRSGRALGRPGQPVNVKITKDNFKDFLSS